MSQTETRRREKVILPPPRSPEEMGFTTGQEVVASNLSPQLGTDVKDLAKGGVDMRRLSIINEPLMMAITYFSWRGKKVRFWKHTVEQVLNLAPSINGVGRNQLIRMQQATTPGSVIPPEPEKPGWWGRNVSERDWREKAARQ